MRKKLMKYFENSFGTGCGKRHERKSQHKKFRGRISRLLIAEWSEENLKAYYNEDNNGATPLYCGDCLYRERHCLKKDMYIHTVSYRCRLPALRAHVPICKNFKNLYAKDKKHTLTRMWIDVGAYKEYLNAFLMEQTTPDFSSFKNIISSGLQKEAEKKYGFDKMIKGMVDKKYMSKTGFNRDYEYGYAPLNVFVIQDNIRYEIHFFDWFNMNFYDEDGKINKYIKKEQLNRLYSTGRHVTTKNGKVHYGSKSSTNDTRFLSEETTKWAEFKIGDKVKEGVIVFINPYEYIVETKGKALYNLRIAYESL